MTAKLKDTMNPGGIVLFSLVIGLLFTSGCRDSKSLSKASGPLTVSVADPIHRKVVDYAQFTGRLNAVDTVEIRSRVTGYLDKTDFEEGSLVKAGQVLCEIDPRTYQAELNAASGALEAATAKYQLAKTENERAKNLYIENPRAISKKALDQRQAEENSAAADVVAARSNVDVYKLKLEFCKITSPIDGRVGRYQVTTGNLVTENTSTLTTVVSENPIHGYCSIDELTLLTALKNLYDGKMPPLNSRRVVVNMGLQNEAGFPHEGVADFADNVLNSSTGTLTVRAVFENPANSKGIRLFIPGMYVRMRIPVNLPQEAVLIADQAIGTDQGQKYVYVLDNKNKVQYRKINLGALQDDGMRVIQEGVSLGDRVVVNGIQLIKSGDQVKSEQVPMTQPNKKTDASENAPSDAAKSPKDEKSDSGTKLDEKNHSHNDSGAPIVQQNVE